MSLFFKITITDPLPQLVDPGVTTGTTGITRSDFPEQHLDGILVTEPGRSQTPTVQIPLLAEGNQFFRKTTGRMVLWACGNSPAQTP